jgi:hypothetical protein
MPLRVRSYTEIRFHPPAGYVCSRYCASFGARGFLLGWFITWASARLTRFNPGFHMRAFSPTKNLTRESAVLLFGARGVRPEWAGGAFAKASAPQGVECGDGKRRRSD